MENMSISLTEKQRRIENHKKIADHLHAASVNHFMAAVHLKEGDYEKAARCATMAKEYIDLASQAKREDLNFIPNLYI